MAKTGIESLEGAFAGNKHAGDAPACHDTSIHSYSLYYFNFPHGVKKMWKIAGIHNSKLLSVMKSHSFSLSCDHPLAPGIHTAYASCPLVIE